ncbi:MAG: hypothetical protein QXG00_07425 [Candidatus Woesearchaeota archaeon]
MKTRYKVFGLLTIMLTMVLFSNLQSQPTCSGDNCPDSIPPYNVSWTVAGPATINYNGCEYYVCYCWRAVNDTIQVFVDPTLNMVNPDDPDCPDEPIPPATRAIMLKYFGNYIIQYNPNSIGGFLCPPCLVGTKIYVTFHNDKCYDEGYPCETGYVICRNIYSVCCNGPVRVVTYISTDPFINQCNGDCTPNCP